MLSDETETDLIFQKWEKDTDKLETEIDSFRSQFIKTKNCNCDITKCTHYKTARQRIFGIRIDTLYNESLQIGFRVYSETINYEIDSKLEHP